MSKKAQTLLILSATLIIGILIGALGSGAMRQHRRRHFDRMPPEERFHQMMERIIRPTGAQHKELEAVLGRRYDQIAEIREGCEDEIIAIFDSIHADVLSILTAEQRKRLEEHLEKGPREMAMKRIARLAEELQLDEEQKEQLRKLVAETFKQPFGPPGNPPGGRPIRGRFQKLRKDIEALLTPEQLEKFRALRKRRRVMFGPPPGPRFRPRDRE